MLEALKEESLDEAVEVEEESVLEEREAVGVKDETEESKVGMPTGPDSDVDAVPVTDAVPETESETDTEPDAVAEVVSPAVAVNETETEPVAVAEAEPALVSELPAYPGGAMTLYPGTEM